MAAKFGLGDQMLQPYLVPRDQMLQPYLVLGQDVAAIFGPIGQDFAARFNWSHSAILVLLLGT